MCSNVRFVDNGWHSERKKAQNLQMEIFAYEVCVRKKFCTCYSVVVIHYWWKISFVVFCSFYLFLFRGNVCAQFANAKVNSFKSVFSTRRARTRSFPNRCGQPSHPVVRETNRYDTDCSDGNWIWCMKKPRNRRRCIMTLQIAAALKDQHNQLAFDCSSRILAAWLHCHGLKTFPGWAKGEGLGDQSPPVRSRGKVPMEIWGWSPQK